MGICFQKNRVRSGQRNWSVRVCHYHNGIIEKAHIMSKICHLYSVIQAQFCSLCFRYFNSVALYSVALIVFVFSLVSYKVVFVPFNVTFLLNYTLICICNISWSQMFLQMCLCIGSLTGGYSKNNVVTLDLHITQSAEKRFPKRKKM